jgi:uncharacterized UBP type Zn finger protein
MKDGTVTYVQCGGCTCGRGNEGDEGEGMWWMDLYRTKKPLAIALSGVGRWQGEETMGVM